MRILVVSFRFPPSHSVGAVSVGKTVKYLERAGHDVRVLTARDQHLPTTLRIESDPAHIVATNWWSPTRAAEGVAGGSERVATQGFSAGRRYSSRVAAVGRAYRSVMIPDQQVGWTVPAIKAGRELIRDWKPDVIYGSAPPFTSLVVARALSRHSGVPWVAGLRDLWRDNPYRRISPVVRGLDRRLEQRVLTSARGVAVTTDESALTLRSRFALPIEVVTNGYDADDLVERSTAVTDQLVIRYAGLLVHDRRDPTPLFRALRLLPDAPVRVEFYGRDASMAAEAAAREGVTDRVFAYPPVPHRESLQLQRDADVLLLLQWQHPSESGTCPAKLFEYAATRRPVLAIGPTGGVVDRLLTQHRLGSVLTDQADIADQLRVWVRSKSNGGIPDLPGEPPPELSRRTQVQRLAMFLSLVTGGEAAGRSGG
jgi:glycosyltransferase involved in cell wall biosynthesis